MNNQIKTISKIFGSEIILKIILGLTSILIARKIDANSYSDYFYFITITNMCINIPSSFFNKIFFTDKNKAALANIKSLNIILYFSLLAFIFLIITTTIIPFSSFFLFYISFLLIFIRVLYLYNQTVLQSKLNFKKLYLREFIRVISYSIPSTFYLFMTSNPKIEIVILTLFFSFLFTEIINRISLNGGVGYKYLLDLNRLCFDKENRFTFLFTLSFLVLTSLDTLMLKSLSTEVELSNFGAAFTLYSFLMLGLSSIHKYILPKASNSKVSEFQSILKPIFKIGVLLIPILIIGVFISKTLFDLMFGLDKYPNAHVLFSILSLSAVFSFFFSPYSNLLNKLGMFKFQFKMIILGLVSIMLLNYFLIPNYGALAVTINNLFIYSLINFSFYIKAKSVLQNNLSV